MAKVLISFLGTGRPRIEKGKDKPNREGYNKADYKIHNKEYKDIKFIADAIVQHHHIDKVIMAGTMKSIWEVFYEIFSEKEKKFDEDFYWELWKVCNESTHQSFVNRDLIGKIEDKINLNTKIVLLEYGINDEEFTRNFEKLIHVIEDEDFIQDGDELYLDITHAFRSIPIYIMMVLLYLRDVSSKKVEIKDILYGMYEMKWELPNKISPIVSLKPTLEVLEWIKGADNFKEFGKGFKLAQLLKAKGNATSKHIEDFSNITSINYLHEVEQKANDLKNIDFENLPGPAKLIVPPVINNFTKRFQNTRSKAKFQLELANWHYDNKNYSSAYIVLAESIVTHICELEGKDWTDRDDRRDAKNLIRNGNQYSSIKLIEMKVSNIRNNIAHNKMATLNTFENDIKELVKYIGQLRNIYISPSS